MKIWLVIISISLVFIAGCATQKPTEVQFKNDVITIENYVVDNVAPYVGQDVSISFDIKNNGDKPVKWVTVNFFDTPGFEVVVLDCLEFGQKINNKPPDVADEKGYISERSCGFGDREAVSTTLDVIDPLDTRSVKLILKTPTNINSPTPFTVSFSVAYRYGSILQQNTYFYSGERSAIIPIIDPNFKKEPSSKFSQSDSTKGPIVFDIMPSLEREKIVDDKTIKEYWGVVGTSFQTKFVMKKIVSEGTLKDILPPTREFSDCKSKSGNCINIQLTNLEIGDGICNFVHPQTDKTKGMADKIVNEKNNTLICSFKPITQGGFAPEFTSSITIQYNYEYEIVRKQNFVVYPAIS